MSTADECVEFPLLAELAADEQRALCALGRSVTVGPGQRLFEEGGEAISCWLIHAGSVALDTAVPGEGLVVIQTLGAGDVLGWSWLVPPYRWHFGARVLQTLRATELDAARLRVLADRNPGFGYAVARLLLAAALDRLQSTRARLLDLYGAPHGG